MVPVWPKCSTPSGTVWCPTTEPSHESVAGCPSITVISLQSRGSCPSSCSTVGGRPCSSGGHPTPPTVLLPARRRGLHENGHAQLFQQLGGSPDKEVDLCMASLSALASVSDLLGNDPSQPPLWCSLW